MGQATSGLERYKVIPQSAGFYSPLKAGKLDEKIKLPSHLFLRLGVLLF